MGDKDKIIEAMKNYGKNKVIEFKGGYFSFAMGNEIALILNNTSGYFILNCDIKLFNECKKKIKSSTKKEIIDFWKNKSKEYKISVWSNDFGEMK